MKRSFIIAIIAAAILVPATVYAASPLFVNSTIDEPLPAVKTGGSSPMQGGSVEKEEATVKDETMVEKEDAMMMTKETSGTFAGAGDGIHNAQGSARQRKDPEP